MAVKVKMFTKTVCPTCKIAKQQLSFLPVPVEIMEYNIEEDYIPLHDDVVPAEKYLTEYLESMSTPTFEFESGRIIRGYNEGEIREELGL